MLFERVTLKSMALNKFALAFFRKRKKKKCWRRKNWYEATLMRIAMANSQETFIFARARGKGNPRNRQMRVVVDKGENVKEPDKDIIHGGWGR